MVRNLYEVEASQFVYTDFFFFFIFFFLLLAMYYT